MKSSMLQATWNRSTTNS